VKKTIAVSTLPILIPPLLHLHFIEIHTDVDWDSVLLQQLRERSDFEMSTDFSTIEHQNVSSNQTVSNVQMANVKTFHKLTSEKAKKTVLHCELYIQDGYVASRLPGDSFGMWIAVDM
jgi:hypothetical protein